MARFLHGTNQIDTSSRFSSTTNITQRERRNGWSCPWHPLQLIAWFFIVYFAITYFGILVFYLPLEWRPAGFIIPGGLYVIHIVVHIVALSRDPADPNIRQGPYHEKAVFHPNNHQHVIENNHCHICQADVFPKSKHCSSCNKCVSDFDHHCKWLNTCVGGRNYKLFLACISTAFAGAVTMATVTLYLFIYFFIHKTSLQESQADGKFNLFIPVSDAAFIVFVGVNEALYLLAICLLGHLLGFHLYLIYLNMSTYEFIVNSREKKIQLNTDAEAACRGTPISLKHFRNNKVLPTPEVMENNESSADTSQPSSVEQQSETTVKVMNEISSKVAKRNSTNALFNNQQNGLEDSELLASHKPKKRGSVNSSSSSSMHELETTLQDRIENVTVHTSSAGVPRDHDHLNTEMTAICRAEGSDLKDESNRITNNSTSDNLSTQALSDSDGEELLPIEKVVMNHGEPDTSVVDPPVSIGDRLPPLVRRPLPHLGTYDSLSNC